MVEDTLVVVDIRSSVEVEVVVHILVFEVEVGVEVEVEVGCKVVEHKLEILHIRIDVEAEVVMASWVSSGLADQGSVGIGASWWVEVDKVPVVVHVVVVDHKLDEEVLVV